MSEFDRELEREEQERAHAPYLLCAACGRARRGTKGSRCRKGATVLRDGYAVCKEHAETNELRLHLNAVPYNILKPTLHDQFSRELSE